MAHITHSQTSISLERCSQYIQCLRSVTYQVTSPGQIMLMMVKTASFLRAVLIMYSGRGTPISEIKYAGQPPRILSQIEQEKLRTVCRVGLFLRSFRPSYHSYLRVDKVFTLPQLAREVLDIAASHVRPGVTTDAIDAIVHDAIIERNAYPSPLNYRKFPKSVCLCAPTLSFLYQMNCIQFCDLL
jgi:hypothetical protein